MKKKVFISRELDADSVFLTTLTKAGYDVMGHSLITFTPLSFSLPKQFDWIFFYSKKAVHFFFENISVADIDSKIAAFGPGTAQFLAKKKINVDYIGTGKGKSTARDFLQQANKQKILFPRASQSQKTIQRLLKNEIEVIDLIIYDNQIRPNIQLSHFDYLVFTSPLNAQAYFDQNDLKDNQTVIAIGKTTAKKLKKLGITQITVAKKPSEKSLAKAITNN